MGGTTARRRRYRPVLNLIPSSLSGNRLTTVGPRDLAGLVNLQHLIVNNNQLVKVSVQAFDDFLLTLEDLDMSYNNLRR